MDKKKLKYNDVPRFDLTNKYEGSAKKDYQDIVVDMVKLLNSCMIQMTKDIN